MAIKALSMIVGIFASLCLVSSADAYDPTSWHLSGYVAGSEGQHTAAYDALHGHGHVSAPAHITQPHALTARDNAYILCITGREPADFDFDGTCHQVTKNNQSGGFVRGGLLAGDRVVVDSLHGQVYTYHADGTLTVHVDNGTDNYTLNFVSSGGHYVLR